MHVQVDDELTLRCEELTGSLKKINHTVKGMGSASSKGFEQKIDNISRLIDSAEHTLTLYDCEIRGAKDQHQKRFHKQKFQQLKSELAELTQSLTWAKSQDTRKQIFSGADHAISLDQLDAKQGIGYGSKLQAESLISVQKSIQMSEEAREIGQQAAVKAKQQTDQLSDVYEHLDEISSTMERSLVVIKRISRRVITDKYMWVFIFLIIVAIVAIVAYKVTTGKDLKIQDELVNV